MPQTCPGRQVQGGACRVERWLRRRRCRQGESPPSMSEHFVCFRDFYREHPAPRSTQEGSGLILANQAFRWCPSLENLAAHSRDERSPAQLGSAVVLAQNSIRVSTAPSAVSHLQCSPSLAGGCLAAQIYCSPCAISSAAEPLPHSTQATRLAKPDAAAADQEHVPSPGDREGEVECRLSSGPHHSPSCRSFQTLEQAQDLSAIRLQASECVIWQMKQSCDTSRLSLYRLQHLLHQRQPSVPQRQELVF